MTTATATAIAPAVLAIDKTHSEVFFQVRHLVTRVRGRFTDFEGTIHLDDANSGQGAVAFTIQAASIDTGTADRDAHLRSADFFDVEKYPTIDFRSTGIERSADQQYAVAGLLTMHGVTRPITLPVTPLGAAKDAWGNVKTGFEAEITLNRKDFGLVWNALLETGGFAVGDEVKVSLSIQAAARQ